MGRRRFDHLVTELSLAAGAPVERYALWLHLHEDGVDPERLGLAEALAFCRGSVGAFLAAHGLVLSRRAQRRLCRAVDAWDPARPSPEDLFARWEGER